MEVLQVSCLSICVVSPRVPHDSVNVLTQKLRMNEMPASVLARLIRDVLSAFVLDEGLLAIGQNLVLCKGASWHLPKGIALTQMVPFA